MSQTRNAIEYTSAILNKVDLLAQPLYESLGLSSFGYKIFKPDGTSIGLCSNIDWFNFFNDHFLGKKVASYDEHISRVVNGSQNVFLRCGNPDSTNGYSNALYDLDMWNAITIYIKFEDTIDVFYFIASKNHAEDMSYYLNKIDLLKRFILYFKEKSVDLFDENIISKLFLPTLSARTSFNAPSCPKESMVDQRFIDSTPVSFVVNQHVKKVKLSRRETECLSELAKGKTTKEIARHLSETSEAPLAYRTVETYLDNIRGKTGLHTKSELIELFYSNPFFSVFW